MKKLILLLLPILLVGCVRYKFDEKLNRCRDLKTGRIVDSDLCK